MLQLCCVDGNRTTQFLQKQTIANLQHCYCQFFHVFNHCAIECLVTHDVAHPDEQPAMLFLSKNLGFIKH